MRAARAERALKNELLRRLIFETDQLASPVGDVGKCKQLRLLFARSTALAGHAQVTPFTSRTEEHAGRAAIEL